MFRVDAIVPLVIVAIAVTVVDCRCSSESSRPMDTGFAPDTAHGEDAGRPLRERAEEALDEAAVWMAGFPEVKLRFDAAIALNAVVEHHSTPQLAAEFERASKLANEDDDNPMRRFWIPDHPAGADAVRSWEAPADGSRINTNRPLIEGLYCDRHGLREQTVDYILGPMRDEGGYHTIHGLWALVLARENGCLDAKRFEEVARPLVEELWEAQSTSTDAPATKNADLFAERLAVLQLADADVDDATLRGWVGTLLKMQNGDGGWGRASDDEVPYYRYHATMMSAWALAHWLDASSGAE